MSGSNSSLHCVNNALIQLSSFGVHSYQYNHRISLQAGWDIKLHEDVVRKRQLHYFSNLFRQCGIQHASLRRDGAGQLQDPFPTSVSQPVAPSRVS